MAVALGPRREGRTRRATVGGTDLLAKGAEASARLVVATALGPGNRSRSRGHGKAPRTLTPGGLRRVWGQAACAQPKGTRCEESTPTTSRYGGRERERSRHAAANACRARRQRTSVGGNYGNWLRDISPTSQERVTGIEPALSAWEAEVLPLNYTRAALRRLPMIATGGALPGRSASRPGPAGGPVVRAT